MLQVQQLLFCYTLYEMENETIDRNNGLNLSKSFYYICAIAVPLKNIFVTFL